MKNKLKLFAAVLVAGGTMFAQSRPFVGNGAANYGSGSNNVFRSDTAYRENAYRTDDRRSLDRSYNDRLRHDDRRFDYRDRNRWDERRNVYIDDCRR